MNFKPIRLSLCIPIVFIVLPSCANTPSSERTVEASSPGKRAKTLVELALNEGKAYELLKELTTVAPHRLSGSVGAEIAVNWGLETMRQMGLENVRRVACMVPHWVRGDTCKVTIQSSHGEEELPALALGGSVGTKGVNGEVLMIRHFKQLENIGDKAKGKIVFFNRPMPRALLNTFAAYGQSVPQRTQGAFEAAKVGAVAAIVRSMTTRIDDSPHTGAMRYGKGVAKLPTAAISTRAAEHLSKLLKSGETVELSLVQNCKTLPDVPSANVVGELRGSELPEEYVVIGGHLDCWDVGQGAHDDGAGVVHSLEAVRLLMLAGYKPKRTIRVVLFMNEENGLRGARAYAASQAKDRHIAAIESDRGGFRPRGFTSSARGAELQRYKKIADALRPYEMGAMIPGSGGADVNQIKNTTTFGLIPSSQRYFDYHHSERDTIEMVNERELQLGAAAIAYLALELANQ